MRSLYRLVREIGLDPRRLGLIGDVPRYVRDLRTWKRRGGTVTSLYPILTDRQEDASGQLGAYFHQDMLVARRVLEAAPKRHMDVGSRIDGFVAHVAVFRPIDVLDIRPLHSTIHNVRFIEADLMQATGELAASTDSLSCLHALEHFGLGRYGDPINPEGHLKGFRNLIDMLVPEGTLYLSFPIGAAAVEYNAHRVFDCQEVLSWPGSESLRLKGFDFVDDHGVLHESVPPKEIPRRCAALRHGCGIYTFARAH